MRVIEKAVHWVFAAFMATVAYFAAMALGAFLTLKLLGLEVGVQPPADFQPWIGPTAMTLWVGILLFAPLALATFVGAMTAPFAQRGLAAVVFPVLVFAAITWMTRSGAHGLAIGMLLETAASCAVPGIWVFIQWRRHQLRLGRA